MLKFCKLNDVPRLLLDVYRPKVMFLHLSVHLGRGGVMDSGPGPFPGHWSRVLGVGGGGVPKSCLRS